MIPTPTVTSEVDHSPSGQISTAQQAIEYIQYMDTLYQELLKHYEHLKQEADQERQHRVLLEEELRVSRQTLTRVFAAFEQTVE